MKKFSFLTLSFLFLANIAYAQEITPVDALSSQGSIETAIEKSNSKKSFWNTMPYIFDDIMVVGGFNRSGLYYTVNYRDISHITGHQLGLEAYYPVFDKAFLHFGMIYSRRGFEEDVHNIRFETFNLDFPLYLSYELPPFRVIDFRIILGGQMSTMIGTRQFGRYPTFDLGDNPYIYDPNAFRRFDFGYVWGLSSEYKQVYVRAKIYSGLIKLMPDDQGMNSSFTFEVGYFLFRGLRK